MATRWSFSSHSARSRAAASLALVTLACVSTVTRYYLPDATNPRFDTDRATQVMDQYLRVQCPERLAANKSASGEARLTIITDTTGAVTRAELVRSTGDEIIDGMFGTVSAQLKIDSLRATTKPSATRNLRLGFSCASDAAVATLQVLP